ncbi:hypothetical protein D3C80_1243400 [compost metagenome]
MISFSVVSRPSSPSSLRDSSMPSNPAFLAKRIPSAIVVPPGKDQMLIPFFIVNSSIGYMIRQTATAPSTISCSYRESSRFSKLKLLYQQEPRAIAVPENFASRFHICHKPFTPLHRHLRAYLQVHPSSSYLHFSVFMLP